MTNWNFFPPLVFIVFSVGVVFRKWDFALQSSILSRPHEDTGLCQGAEPDCRSLGELSPLSKDLQETWQRPEVSGTKLYYHNPIKCVWGLMSCSQPVGKQGESCQWLLVHKGLKHSCFISSFSTLRWVFYCDMRKIHLKHLSHQNVYKNAL